MDAKSTDVDNPPPYGFKTELENTNTLKDVIEASPVSTEKIKYPFAVFFIIVNEFCERFSYYGMRTILTIYLKTILGFDEDTATVLYHVFIMLCYFTPVLGAILADAFLGKFRTILYLSILYACGSIILSVAAIPNTLPQTAFSLIGLFIIAFGTGGIKPCVSAFGGDQFIRPQQDKQLEQFFSIFYFAINSGSLISTFLTPILRDDVHCFDENSCFSLAFGVPAILMLTAVVVFVLGKPRYQMKDPETNVFGEFCFCISHAIARKCSKASRNEHHDHWLDYASDKYPKSLIEDIKRVLRVGLVFIPLPVFWALYDQQGSRWTFQATRMNGALGSAVIKPDQMQIVNPLLILILVPIFESLIYPLLAKCFNFSPLRRIGAGMIFCGLSFVVSGIVELQLEPTYEHLPSAGLTQLDFVNTLPCRVDISYAYDNQEIEFQLNKTYPSTYVIDQLFEYKVDQNISVKAVADQECGDITMEKSTFNGVFYLAPESEKQGFSVIATVRNKTLVLTRISQPVPLTKSESGDPKLEFILSDLSDSFQDFEITIQSGGHPNAFVLIPDSDIEDLYYTNVSEVEPWKYDIYIDPKTEKPEDVDRLPVGSISLIQGGCYVVVIQPSSKNSTFLVLEVTPANSVHILWLVPQYFVVTVGEVMFSVTGLTFSFTQAPPTMRAIMQAMWALIVAFGNLIVIIIAEVQGIQRQAIEFFVFAGIMGVAAIVFTLLALGYKYVEETEAEELATSEKKNSMEKPPMTSS
jgi:solute carrier family 15 oligopeptide transporter 1